MAFTFAVADGLAVGDSLHEDEDGQAEARRAQAACAAHDCELLLPVDIVAGRGFSADTEVATMPFGAIQPGWMGLDIGPRSAAAYAQRIATRAHGLLERPDGRVRAGRRSQPARAPSPRPSPTAPATPSSAAATRSPPSRRPASPIASITSRPAAAPGSSCWKGTSSRAWPRSRREEP